MATRKNILTACFVAALSVGLAACGSSTTEVVNTPPSLALGGAAAINEGMTGRTGLMVTATDGQDDTITYEVSDARFDVVGGMLVVVAGTLLDYETERSIAVDITASDGALSSDTKTANVTVRNVDDVPLTLSTSGTRGNIVEGTTGGTGLTFMADDNDMLGNLMFSTNVEGFDVIPLGEGRYELVVTQALDREQMNEVQVVVTATDDHGSKMTPTLTIAVGGVNDTPPMLGMQGVGMIDENEMGDTSVYFRPTDADGDTMFTFHVEGDNRESFRVVPAGFQTYALQVTDAFDYESDGGTVKVTVTMADSAGMSDTATFDVMVNDVNDNAPMVTTMGSAAIDEEKTGSTMLKVGVMDADSVGVDPVWTVDDARFTIDANGYLVLNEAIDYDGAMGAMSVDVGVMANDGANDSNRRTVTVTINPVNDNPPVITVSGEANLEEDTFDVDDDRGTGITVSVTDKDGDMVSPTVSDPRFTFADDGSLMIAADSTFDYEMMEDRSITLTITASDGTNNAMAQTAVVTFMDVNDNKPVLKVTDNQGGPALEVVTRDEGLVSANTPTGHKVKVEDADTHETPMAMVSDGRFYIDENGYLMIKADSEFNFENEADKSIALQITANDGQNAEASYIINFNIADVDEPPMITGNFKPRIVMGPYGDGQRDVNDNIVQRRDFEGESYKGITTLMAKDPEGDDLSLRWVFDPSGNDFLIRTINRNHDELTIQMAPGTFLGRGQGNISSKEGEGRGSYTGYVDNDEGLLRRVLVDIDDADLDEKREDIQISQVADRIVTSRALATYETYKVEPSDEHEAGATVDEQRMGKPSAEEFVPSFDHLTDGDIKVDERRGGDMTTRLLTDLEIRRGILQTPSKRGGGTSFDNRSENPSLLPELSLGKVLDGNGNPKAEDDDYGPGDIGDSNIMPDNISKWYKTRLVSPEIALPMEPMALDIVTDTRSVDIKSSAIKKGRELAIRYRWSDYGLTRNVDVALIDDDDSGRVLEEYRRREGEQDGPAYQDHSDFANVINDIDDHTGLRKPDDDDDRVSPLSIEVDVANADNVYTSADRDDRMRFGMRNDRDVMNYAKFGLWSYNNRRGCSNCPDEGLRGATAFGLKAKSRDLDNQTHVGVWEGTTVAFWGDKESDGSIDPEDLGIGSGNARIAVNFGNNKVQANMSVSDHRFEFKGGLLGGDRLEYSANINTTDVLAPQGAIEYMGSNKAGNAGKLDGPLSDDRHRLSADSNGNIHATGSLSGFFYGPSIPAGSTAAAARASTETAGTWEITDVPGRDPNDTETIIIGAFGAGLVENVRIGDDRFTDDPDPDLDDVTNKPFNPADEDRVDWIDIDTGPTGIGGESR